MASVQFYGVDKAIEAYENCKIPAWGLFSGKQLLCRYTGNDLDEGAKLLEDFISKIEESTATYTLKVFEQEGNKPVKIKEKTECDSSFNFKIDEQEIFTQRQEQRGYGNRALGATLSSIDERLKKIEELPIEEESEEETFQESIGKAIQQSIIGAIQNPEQPNLLVDLLKGVLNVPVSKPAIGNVRTTSAIAGLETGNANASVKERGDKLQRLGDAIDILEKHDEKLVEHLEALAKIAVNNPQKFQRLIAMIDMI
jgi:hypothetical protein